MLRLIGVLLAFLGLFFLFPMLACDDDDSGSSTGQADDDDDDDDDVSVDDDDDDDNDNDDNDNDDDNDNNDDNDNDNDDDDDATPIPMVTDELGREVVIHGVNYMGLEFGWYDHQPEDFQRIAEWGFTHVRLPFSWRYMEPEPGVWDASYLTDRVAPVLDMIHDAGLRAVPDMHQWQWCSSFGGNGAPDWTCEGLYEENLWGLMQYAADFWTGELHEHWAAAWELTWQELAGHPAVWAWDLFNEPWAGLNSFLPTFERDTLTAYYQTLYDTLRLYDAESWVFLEPSMVSATLPSYLEPIAGEKLIYSPHLYTGFTSFDEVGYWFPPAMFDFDMRKSDRVRARLGYPLVSGESGVTTCAEGALDWMRDAAAAHDAYLYGEITWCYWKSDCSWSLLYADGTEKIEFLYHLLRPYPRAVAGHIETYGFDPETSLFTLTFTNTAATGETLIFASDRHYPEGFTVACTDPEGSWSSTYDEATHVLAVITAPDVPTHTITVSPQR